MIIELGISQVVRQVFPPKPPKKDTNLYRKLGSAAHSAVAQYFRTILTIKEASIDNEYMKRQLKWSIDLSINSNFSGIEENKCKEFKKCVRHYLQQHHAKIDVLGEKIKDGSYNYLFPLSVERKFYNGTQLKVNGKSIWLKGKIDLLWLSREYEGVLIEEIKSTSWRDKFFQEMHELQAGLYYYLVTLEPGLIPANVVKLSYLTMLDNRDVFITDDLIEKIENAIIETAKLF